METITPKETASKLEELARDLEAESALPHRQARPVMTALLSAYLAGFDHGASRRVRLSEPTRK